MTPPIPGSSASIGSPTKNMTNPSTAPRQGKSARSTSNNRTRREPKSKCSCTTYPLLHKGVYILRYMDWSVLVPSLVSVATGSILTPFGVFLTQRMTNKREKENCENQRMLKERELEEARFQRLRDDRIKAYTEFARLTYTYKITNPDAVVGVLAAYSAVELLSESSETREAADELREKITLLRGLADKAEWVEESGKTTTDDLSVDLVKTQVRKARQVFLSKAKAELGIDQL
jgi:hypothetical protein